MTKSKENFDLEEQKEAQNLHEILGKKDHAQNSKLDI